MKVVGLTLCLLFGAFLANAGADAAGGDKTITKVVKLLQRMLDKSKKESDDDKTAYAKYACYVATNEAEKTASVKKLGEQIDLLESSIAQLQARNGELSGKTAELAANMADNEAAQKSATGVRDSSEKSFGEMAADLEKGIGQMQEALDVLGAIALDQTKSAAFQKQFMGGYPSKQGDAVLLNLGSEVKNALNAVSALLPADSENHQALKSFLQAPLAAAHNAKGDAIVGILKNLMETFKGNLANARTSEAAEKKAFDSSIEVLKDSYDKMAKSLKEKKQDMGTNDGQLSSDKTSLEEAVKQKKSDEEFLDKLREMSKTKAKDYDERKMMRANEDAAIAEAISILNSDSAFSTFGSVDATSTGKVSFLQLRAQDATVRGQTERLLEAAAAKSHSARLARVVDGLRTGNPFNEVLAEIKKMKETIAAEGAADAENKAWCTKERTNSNKDLDAKKSQIKTLDDAIGKLDETINDPKTGLLQQIVEKDASLVQNQKAQVDQTKTRKDENVAYQEDVQNLGDAEDILGKAIAVLSRYYDQLDKKMKENNALLQSAEDPKPPETYDAFSGQSKSGGSAISMLEFIQTETQKEHAKADSDEKSAQKEFDESMAELTKAETEMQEALVKLNEDLSEKKKELQEKTADLKDTTAAKEAIEQYLSKIKSGCDFIADNFDLREKNRATETTALDKAVTLIKDTPAYKSAAAKK